MTNKKPIKIKPYKRKDGTPVKGHNRYIDKKEKVIQLNPVTEFKNVCVKCGMKNSLYPKWINKKRVYWCESCYQISRGVTESEYEKRKLTIIDKTIFLRNKIGESVGQVDVHTKTKGVLTQVARNEFYGINPDVDNLKELKEVVNLAYQYNVEELKKIEKENRDKFKVLLKQKKMIDLAEPSEKAHFAFLAQILNRKFDEYIEDGVRLKNG